MRSKKSTSVKETNFEKLGEILINGRLIVSGDLIKIHGEHGAKFRFNCVVTNKENGATWIDCFEMDRGAPTVWRSFKSDRIKLIPIKRGKRKNVN